MKRLFILRLWGVLEHVFEVSGVGSRESGIGNRESGIGNRESGIGNREMGRWGDGEMGRSYKGMILIWKVFAAQKINRE
ncbi:MAG: hypothetical protein F6K26_30205 [Moorea sp. SIO2I5]|nr:hypothetical protein [Moorena sp. SIO2I5]